MLLLFHWLAKTWLAITLRDSTWAFAIIEIIHLLALAVFGGAILILNLRFLGIGLKTQPSQQVAQELFPAVLTGIGVMFVSGFLLLASGPMRYYYNPAFRIKMLLFFIAMLIQILFQAKITQQQEEWPMAQKAFALLSLLLWLSIGLAGRAIGYV